MFVPRHAFGVVEGMKRRSTSMEDDAFVKERARGSTLSTGTAAAKPRAMKATRVISSVESIAVWSCMMAM